MSQFCEKCGAELMQAGNFCPGCGEPVSAADAGQEPKKKRRLKWWMIVIPIVLVFAIAVGIFWESIYIRIVPEKVLAQAWQNTAGAETAKWSGGLGEQVSAVLGDSNTSSVDMAVELDVSEEMALSFGMTGAVDGNTTQTQMNITLNAQEAETGQEIDMAMDMYLDRDFLAVRMEQLTGEDYIGIAFDSFGEDIRNSPMLSGIFDGETLTQVEETVAKMKETLNLTNTESALAEKLPQILTEFADALPKPTVEPADIELNRMVREGYAIRYEIAYRDYVDLFAQFVSLMEEDEVLQHQIKTVFEDPEAWDDFLQIFTSELADLQAGEGTVTLSFYVYNEYVVQISLGIQGAGEEVDTMLELTFGENPGTDDLFLKLVDNATRQKVTVTLQSVNSEDTIERTVTMSTAHMDDDFDAVLGYKWDSISGDLEIFFEETSKSGNADVQFHLDCNLTVETDCVRFEMTDDLSFLDTSEDFMAEFAEGEYHLTCTLREGSEITVPDYTNIGDLTEDMLYKMLLNLYQTQE